MSSSSKKKRGGGWPRWCGRRRACCGASRRAGDRQLNRALHTIAITRAQRDPATKEYLARKEADGKTKKGALRCLKRYLARRFYRLLSEPPLPAQRTITGEQVPARSHRRTRRPGHPARRTGWHVHRRERPRLVARARDHRRVPVRPAPRRCPRTQTCCPTPGHRGADGLARQGGRAAFRRRPRGWCTQRPRADGTDRCRAPSPEGRSPPGREDENGAGHACRVDGRALRAGLRGRVDMPAPPTRRVGVAGDREGRATWRPGTSCRSGPPAAGRLPG